MTNPYEAVTARIIESLKAGVIPWAKPWKGNGSNNPFPRNFKTGAPYRGANILLLWSSPCSSPYWLTFKQAKELGGTVRKGEKGTQILFWKISAKDAEKNQPVEITDDKERKSFFCRSYTVFNVEQCDGLKIPKTIATLPEIDQDERCEAIVTGWASRPSLNLDNAHEGRAYYRPGTDTVHMPISSRFVDAPHYYATLFHELVYSTGHKSRLDRTFGESFGDHMYSKEELVAEVGSGFLCAIAGIANERTEQNSTSYIQHWIEALKGDSRLVITAASAAQKAADEIVGYAFENEDQGDNSKGEAGETGSPFYLPLAA
jgi:antirestriction protein ArdC